MKQGAALKTTYTQKVPAQGEEERGTHQMMMNATINREKSIT
jgi:hypothetical protein